VAFALPIPAAEALNVRRLEPEESRQRESIVASLDPLIQVKRKEGAAALLTWKELYEPLSAEQRKFLDDFRALRAEAIGATSRYFGDLADTSSIVPVGPQRFIKNGQEVTIDLQYLPSQTLEAYQRMMEAMEADLGRRLLVESGYRSSAYQLYLFLFYMPNHDLSIMESNRHVALPGHSEHGYPPQQAIDFINQEGVNGEYDPDAFEALPEFAWLQEHAAEHGFFLSYPRNNPSGSAYEPWHWHHARP
jgi:hypothetical protein